MGLRIVICDGQRCRLLALRELLASAAELTLVGEAQRRAELVPLVSKLEPDLVLLSLQLPDVDALVVLRRLRARFPQLKLLVLSASEEAETIAAVLAAGADAFLSRQIRRERLLALLRQIKPTAPLIYRPAQPRASDGRERRR